MKQTFLVRICSDNICICIDINLSKAVADDLLLCEKIQKYCLVRLTGRKTFVNGSHCSKLGIVARASVKQLFIKHLGLCIILFTNLRVWENRGENKMSVV